MGNCKGSEAGRRVARVERVSAWSDDALCRVVGLEAEGCTISEVGKASDRSSRHLGSTRRSHFQGERTLGRHNKPVEQR